MKKTLSVMIVMIFLVGCAKWDVVAPTVNGDITVSPEGYGFVISFIYGPEKAGLPDTLEILNPYWEGVRMDISHKVSWSSYQEIFHDWVPGRTLISELVFFEKGYKIQIKIDMEDSDGEGQTIYTYFQLGKIVYNGNETEAEIVEFRQEGRCLIAEITLR